MKAVAKALIYDTEDNILVLQRSEPHPRYPHEADLPGGEIEGGEDPVQALLREIAEETGLTVDETSIQFAGERTAASGTRHQVYTARINRLKPAATISWEHESYEWVPSHDILARLDTADDYMIVVRDSLSGA